MPLFRSESQEARANAWLGRILLARPLSFSVLTAAAVGMAVALGALFFFGDYTRKARVTGTLAPIDGVVRLVAPQSGRVEALAAREGASARAGERLLVIADPRTSATGTGAAAEAVARLGAERQHALSRQRDFAVAALEAEQAAVSQRRAALGRELDQAVREAELQRSRARLARGQWERAAGLEARGFVSAAALDREADAAMDHEARLQSTRRASAALAREIGTLDFEGATALARARAQLAAIDAQLAALAQERVERELQYRAEVRAPAAGLVAAVLVEPGQSVTAGTTLATLIPAGASLEAHLFAPSRAIGFVRPGQHVLLRYGAYPHQKFGMHRARVLAISRSALAPGELGVAPDNGSREPLYRIKVALPAQSIDAYGRPEPLRAGMQVEADILLDRRRLIEWVFEPLLGLAGRT